MKLDLEDYNKRIRQDLREIVADIKKEGKSLNIQHRAYSFSDVSSRKQYTASSSPTPSLGKIRGGSKTDEGAVNEVSIKFPRVLIYTHKGAGKGRGGTKGSKWVDAYGNQKTTRSSSKGKMGTGGRKEKPFINNILDSEKGVDKIATTAAEALGDAIVNKMLVK